MKSLTGYRTLLFNAIMAAVLIFNAASPETEVPTAEEVSGFLDQLLANLDSIIAVVGNIILRFFTKTPVGEKV